MIIDGKKVAEIVFSSLRDKIEKVTRKPGLAFILVGEHPASQTYVKMKSKMCEYVGIFSSVIKLPEKISQMALINEVEKLNRDPSIDGILVQMPLPSPLISEKIMAAVDPQKDVDGFHPLNMGKLLLGEEDGFIACTPLGILTLLKHYDLPVENRHVVIVGRSNIVGKPLAALLLRKGRFGDATVTIAHSKSPSLSIITRQADLLIAALGRPHFITKEMVKKGAVVIDVGINRVGNKLIGDVDFDAVQNVASAITPVPGGVGPMTIASLLSNTWMSYQNKV